MPDFELLALMYAEDHGIIEYDWYNGEMIYYSTFPEELTTYKCVVDLRTMQETRTALKRYFKAYDKYVDGRLQANYCV